MRAEDGSTTPDGRVTARYGRHFRVAPGTPPGTGGDEIEAIARGRGLDVVVGDLVRCSQEHGVHVIEQVLPRRNLLFRAEANRTKPLAANVDQVAIVFATQPATPPEFLWRALLAARAEDIAALAVLNKCDLAGADADASLRELAGLGARTLRISARAEPAQARAQLLDQCQGRVTVFLGHSGMGKSTLLALLTGMDLRTSEVSARSGHGRQTTTATRWFNLEGGGAVIDSPGFQEFGLAHLDAQQLVHALPDFAAALAAAGTHCRFANCQHLEEPGCVIRNAVDSAAIAASRYAFYRRLRTQLASAQASGAR